MSIKKYLEDPCYRPPPEIDSYLNGNCDLFAIAANRIFSWDIVAITETRLLNGLYLGKGLIHAFNKIDKHSSNIFDAKGIRNIKLLSDEYFLHPEIEYLNTNEKDLINLVYKTKITNEIEISITSAMIFIERYYKC